MSWSEWKLKDRYIILSPLKKHRQVSEQLFAPNMRMAASCCCDKKRGLQLCSGANRFFKRLKNRCRRPEEKRSITAGYCSTVKTLHFRQVQKSKTHFQNKLVKNNYLRNCFYLLDTPKKKRQNHRFLTFVITFYNF
jgi:hypothetical protein